MRLLGSSIAVGLPVTGGGYILVLIVMNLIDCLAAADCSRGGGTFPCLVDYFNHTSQDIPEDLRAILLPGHSRRRRSRRENEEGRMEKRTAAYKHLDTFQDEWCGAFFTYTDCMNRAKKRCDQAQMYGCLLMSTFSTKFGDVICEYDTSVWNNNLNSKCQPDTSYSVHLSVSEIVIGACSLVTYIYHHVYLS